MFCIDLSLTLAHIRPSALPQVLAEEGSDHDIAIPKLNHFCLSRPRFITLPSPFQFNIIVLFLHTVASLISQYHLPLFSNYHLLDFFFTAWFLEYFLPRFRSLPKPNPNVVFCPGCSSSEMYLYCLLSTLVVTKSLLSYHDQLYVLLLKTE